MSFAWVFGVVWGATALVAFFVGFAMGAAGVATLRDRVDRMEDDQWLQ